MERNKIKVNNKNKATMIIMMWLLLTAQFFFDLVELMAFGASALIYFQLEEVLFIWNFYKQKIEGKEEERNKERGTNRTADVFGFFW